MGYDDMMIWPLVHVSGYRKAKESHGSMAPNSLGWTLQWCPLRWGGLVRRHSSWNEITSALVVFIQIRMSKTKAWLKPNETRRLALCDYWTLCLCFLLTQFPPLMYPLRIKRGDRWKITWIRYSLIIVNVPAPWSWWHRRGQRCIGEKIPISVTIHMLVRRIPEFFPNSIGNSSPFNGHISLIWWFPEKKKGYPHLFSIGCSMN